MRIRKGAPGDLPALLALYEGARAFMTARGNPNQWARTGWPPEEVLREDLRSGEGYVCVNDAGRVIGAFVYRYGLSPEPGYEQIYDGAWGGQGPYAVVHRLAGDGSERGIGAFCLGWAFSRSGHLRVDTHPDNWVMQTLLDRLGFQRRGMVPVEQDPDPRIAYEKIR